MSRVLLVLERSGYRLPGIEECGLAVWKVLVRIKAGKTLWGWVIVVRGEGKCPHNTKTTVEVINVCPNAGRPAEQT